MIETLDVLGDPDALADIRAYLDDPDDVVSAEVMREDMREAARRRR